MNKLTSTLKRHGWLASLVINLIVLGLVLSVTDISYETNDDFGISQEIVAGYPYVGFINYYLCKLLIVVQKVFSEINIFMLSQMVLSFIAFVIITKVYINRSERITEIIISVMLCGFFSLDHYSCLQFTKTAALLMATGLIWAVDNYTEDRKTTIFAAAFTLYYVGALLRYEGMIPAIGYAGIYVMLWWLLNGKARPKDVSVTKEIGVLVLILIILIMPWGINKMSDAKNSETDQLRYGIEYQEERYLITDYPLMGYNANKEKYDSIGISDFDLYLLDRWIFDYDGAASLENLKNINELNRENPKRKASIIKSGKKAVKDSIGRVMNLDFSGMHIAIIISIAIYILCTRRPKTWVYMLALSVFTALLYVSIYHLNRVQYRALYLAELSAALWVLYSALCVERRKTSLPQVLASVLPIMVIMLMMKPALLGLDAHNKHNASKVESAEVTRYYEAHPDNFFVVPTTTAGMPETYKYPLSIPKSLENVTDTGSWDTLTPYRMECLKKCGNINNPIKDLIDNPNGIFVGKYKISMMRDYYNKWHGDNKKRIELVKVGNIKGLELYKVKTVDTNP